MMGIFRFLKKSKPAVVAGGEEEFFTPLNGLELEPYLETEDMMGIHHLARYHWAARVLKHQPPGNLLDIACGAGYGSFLLAGALPGWQVTGVDYDQRAIDWANNHYVSDNLSFLCGDMVSWKVNPGEAVDKQEKFHAIVSFDTIEHVDHREMALLNVSEALDDSGVFILSTPISFPTTSFHPEWPAHKIEYGQCDLKGLLKRYFQEVLVPEDGTLPGMAFWTDYINKDRQRYLNATNPVLCRYPFRT
jgi:2-polyprenyl-3-methyl-5-hydroxy-6-metoxy-1,4-benzoquinol methylase